MVVGELLLDPVVDVGKGRLCKTFKYFCLKKNGQFSVFSHLKKYVLFVKLDNKIDINRAVIGDNIIAHLNLFYAEIEVDLENAKIPFDSLS